MRDMGIVRGSKAWAVPLIIGKDTVYVHTDIWKESTEEGEDLYRFHEKQYGKDEYILMMANESAVTTDTLDAVMGEILPYQQEGIEELTSTVDSILTEILPEIMGLED